MASMYFSKIFLLICGLFPFQRIKSASRFSLTILRSLFSPILKYCAASSILIVYFIQTGTCVSMTFVALLRKIYRRAGFYTDPPSLVMVYAPVEPMPPFLTACASSDMVIP